MSYLVENPEDNISCDKALIQKGVVIHITLKCRRLLECLRYCLLNSIWIINNSRAVMLTTVVFVLNVLIETGFPCKNAQVNKSKYDKMF